MNRTINKPLISVIMPAYNASSTISKAINSVLNQVYKNWELIIVNDGSKDNTLEICKKYETSNILVINQENGGLSKARNEGLKYSRGEYVCFIDSDDWVKPEYLYLLYQSIVDCHSDLSICGLILLRNNSCINLCSQESTCYQFVYKNQKFVEIFETGLLNSSCNKLYKKAIIDRFSIQFKPLALVEDIEFNIQYLQYVYKVSFVKESLYCYEQSNSHLTVRVSKEFFDNYFQIHNLLLNLVDKDFYVFVHRFVYHQYMSIIIKYLIKVVVGELPKKDVFALLKYYVRNSLIKEAFDSYKPLSMREKIIYVLIKHNCFFPIMLYLKIKSCSRK